MKSAPYRAAILLAAVACLAAAPASPPTPQAIFVETFDGGSNEGAWTFGNSFDFIDDQGGDHGPFLRNRFLDTIAPQPRTTLGLPSVFAGDYRARRVFSLGIDLVLIDVDFTAEGRRLSLLLRSDADTPGDFSDDCQVYVLSPWLVPQPQMGWETYDFPVPSGATTLPRRWRVLQPCTGQGPDADWNRTIQDVDEVSFFFGEPTLFYIFQVWDVGMDNPRIRAQGP